MAHHPNNNNNNKRTPILINSRKIRLCRSFLLIGVAVTFLSSILLIAWNEHVIDVQYHPFFRALPLEKKRDSVTSVHPNENIATNNNIRQDQKFKQQKREEWPPVLSVYMEPQSSSDSWYDNPSSKDSKIKKPLPQRNIHRRELTQLSFPKFNYSSIGDEDSSKNTDTTYNADHHSSSTSMCNHIPSLLPIDEFGTTIRDPYLPWIHDLFVSHDGKHVNVVAQNRRRCHKGKNHLDEMKFWEGQVALFQPVAVKRMTTTGLNMDGENHEEIQYRLSTHDEADSDAVETRFVCRFKLIDFTQQTLVYQGETLSTYPFNYEFVNWRKKKTTMVEPTKDQSYFWLSPLMFHCPIPTHLLQYTIPQQPIDSKGVTPKLLLDIIPIRTPVRKNDLDGFFFHKGHGGPTTFNASDWWGNNHILPNLDDSGRWENLPVCILKPPAKSVFSEFNLDDIGSKAENPNNLPPLTSQLKSSTNRDLNAITNRKPHRLVACTWTAALHQRRGNERQITDGKSRLQEWIAFHIQAGFDHLYIFDNTGANATVFRLKNEVDPDLGDGKDNDRHRINNDLSSVTNLFPSSQVTRIDWPATICNNNRPAHDDPGERSSQYAAEAACRLRYGPYTDWMASMDPDEYFIPMGQHTSWKEVLDKVDQTEGRKVLKFRSTRARPVLSTLVPTYDEGANECTHEMGKSNNRCLTKNEENTYLETYNCEYIKSPKPSRFARAMKQLYRPDFVLSHFVHYSTVTTDLATEKQHTKGEFIRDATTNDKVERFVDEIHEGVLIHAKTTVPAETFSRDKMCKLKAASHCLVGIPCPDDLPFSDELHKNNVFHDEKGQFCNCWMNRKVQDYWVPKLKNALKKLETAHEQ